MFAGMALRLAPLLFGGALSGLGGLGDFAMDAWNERKQNLATAAAVRQQTLEDTVARNFQVDETLGHVDDDLSEIHTRYSASIRHLTESLERELSQIQVKRENAKPEGERVKCDWSDWYPSR